MSGRHDEIDPLRAAWKQLQVPDELAHRAAGDPETRACMDWMVSAWSSLDAPPAALRSARSGPDPVTLRRRVVRRVVPFAAAACALFVWRVGQPASELPPAPMQSVEIAQANPERSVTRPVIHPVINRDGSIETRSGNVRLILLPENTSEGAVGATSLEEPPATPLMENSR